jgi:hypothetical protein
MIMSEAHPMKTRVQIYIDALEFLDSRVPAKVEDLLSEIEHLSSHDIEIHHLSFLLGVRWSEHVQGFGSLGYEEVDEAEREQTAIKVPTVVWDKLKDVNTVTDLIKALKVAEEEE